MKSSILLFAFTIGSFVPAMVLGQKLTEKDMIGTTWKLKIDVDEALDEAEEEMEEEGNVLGEIILSGVSGLVKGLINNIDVYFEFEEDNELRVYAEAFGQEDDEVEYTYWEINRRGELIIDDTKRFESDGDGYWVYDDGIFVYIDEDEEDDDPKIFLVEVM